MPSFATFFFFALTLAVTFHYFLLVCTFLLSLNTMRCFLFFLAACAFLLSTDCTRHRLFAFTQQGQGWIITIAIAQVHSCHSSFFSLATNLSLFHFLFQFFSLIFSSWFQFSQFVLLYFLFCVLKNKKSFINLHICACLFSF